MAEPKQSARQQITTFVIIGLLVVLVIGVATLFLSPNSPLRPQASEITTSTTTFSPPQPAEFRDGQISKLNGDNVTVDEASGGSFSFKLNDSVIIRGLNNDNNFEVVSRDKLHTGDFVSVFYQQTADAQRVARVDIMKTK